LDEHGKGNQIAGRWTGIDGIDGLPVVKGGVSDSIGSAAASQEGNDQQFVAKELGDAVLRLVAIIRAQVVREESREKENDSPASSAPNMTVEQYAARCEVASKTVRRWIGLGLPCIQLGRVVRIDPREADGWCFRYRRERPSSRRSGPKRGSR
jgi:hypothetical protein